MNMSLFVIVVIIFTILGGLAGWFLGRINGFDIGFDAGYDRAIMKPIQAKSIEYTCPECGAPLSNHCPGCPYDTEANRALS